MLELLIVGCVILGVTQPDFDSFKPAAIYALFTIMHHMVLGEWEGVAYYASAAVFAAAIITSISVSESVSWLAEFVSRVCVFEVAINAFGAMLWLWYYPTDYYAILYLALYSVVVTVFALEQWYARFGSVDWVDRVRGAIGLRSPYVHVRACQMWQPKAN